MSSVIQESINKWLNGAFDDEVKEQIKQMQRDKPDDVADAFYRNLEFGTGGLRGLMGVGTNRMNKYTVGMATQGYANYLRKSFPGKEVKVAIAHDSRNNSRFFAETAANVFAANGIKVFIFEYMRPTTELSFTIRHFECQGVVVCTASHNPKEYNGYKAYWDDGGQLVPPHDKNVIAEVEMIHDVHDVKWNGGESNITIIGKEVDEVYINMVKGLSVYPEVIREQKDLKIVYTPIHGTGIKLIPQVLKEYGFENVHIVEEQSEPDGNFPTVVYPNPEESEAMSMGLKKAKELDADILCGTDPDADRVGIGVKDSKGNWVLLNGNQTAVLAFNYMIESRKEKGVAKPNDMVVKTIVTTNLIDVIAGKNGVNCYNVLTGFKWIAELIKEKEGQENYVIGGEESYGLMIGSQIRDKDAISAVAILCEMAAYEKSKNRSLYDKLLHLYLQYGYYQEDLVSITKKVMNGQQEIADMMEGFRKEPPKELAGSKVIELLDYQKQVKTDLLSGKQATINLPKSNVLQFVTEDGSKISARPSGTEPKIKFYFSVNTELESLEKFDEAQKTAKQKIQKIIAEMKLG